ncbi:hypothetical protein JW979_07730, partial [bacterium]|nr:hypothetical protein [candidate division CSSED10-310 bacterium]
MTDQFGFILLTFALFLLGLGGYVFRENMFSKIVSVVYMFQAPIFLMTSQQPNQQAYIILGIILLAAFVAF